MASGIYLLRGGETLTGLAERPYDAEEVLQRLLATHPDLLAGDQITPEAPRRWLLVGREAGLADSEGGPDRWSVDHLFLDQDGVPTIVEVKRSSDTRIRREVVGQMLDYAANAVVYWPVAELRARFEALCDERGEDPATQIAEVADATDVDAFWAAVSENLRAGRVRLLFVAEAIPAELLRVIEFLNGQMNPAEVLAVEIRQFVGEGVAALVPRVLGQTVAARQAKSGGSRSGSGRQWDEASFMEDLSERRGAGAVEAARSVLDWAKDSGLRVWWGKGKQYGSLVPMVDLPKGKSGWTVSLWTGGTVDLLFQHMRHSTAAPPFSDPEERLEIVRRVNQIAGVHLEEDSIYRRPSFTLKLLEPPEARAQFLGVLSWMVDEYRKHAG